MMPKYASHQQLDVLHHQVIHVVHEVDVIETYTIKTHILAPLKKRGIKHVSHFTFGIEFETEES